MLVGKTVSVGTTATDLLAGVDIDKTYELVVRYTAAGGVEIALGNSGVTFSNGFQLPLAADIHRFILNGERMYAITQSGTIDLYVLAHRI
jgi:hypothetical protein